MEERFKSAGIQIHSPTRCFDLVFVAPEYKPPSWAEIRRDELRWKLRKWVAFRNKCVVAGIMTVSIILSFLLLLWTLTLPLNSSNRFQIGLIIAMLNVIVHLKATTYIECDPNYVKIKR
jgi:hypothetical protein